MTQRWWLPNVRANETKVRRALKWLDQVTPIGATSALLVEAKTHLYGSDVEEVLGDDQVTALVDRRRIAMSRGGRLQLISTHGNRGPHRFDGSVLIVYAEKNRLNFVDDIEAVANVLVVPWEYSDIAYWVEQWRASNLDGESGAGTLSRRALNPVVQVALETVFPMVATDLSVRPKDRGYLMGALLFCRVNNERFTAEEVRAWAATREGGNPRFADGLSEIANDVLIGRRLHLAKQFGRAGSIERWREQARLRAP